MVREAVAGTERYNVDVEVWQALPRMRRRIVLILGLVMFAAALVLASSGSVAR